MLDAASVSKPHIMVVNLGTPDAPTPAAVRAYLKEFLSDIRVVDLARWKWLPILHGVILPIRSRPVSRKYAEIWLPEGSPLAHYTSSLAAKIATIRPDWVVAPAMRYGSPSMTKLLASWVAAGVEDIRVLPLYPQYSVSTVASVQDVVDAVAPAARVVPPYFAYSGWLDAIAESIRSFRSEHGSGEHLVFSFHGIPKRFADNGDPYPEQNEFSALEIAHRLGLHLKEWTLTYQSRFGREEWLTPATEATLLMMAAEGARVIDIVAPGFAVDCLETLEEVNMGIREKLEALGCELRYIPCLNDSDAHARALSAWVAANA